MPTKVKDSMVGDWIHNNYTNDNYQLWPSFFSQATNFGKRMDVTLKDCNCEPVPLTDEILKKNGFEVKVGPSGKYQLTIEGVNCRVDFNIIEYVHELQHALRLCGIDKEIKLEE